MRPAQSAAEKLNQRNMFSVAEVAEGLEDFDVNLGSFSQAIDQNFRSVGDLISLVDTYGNFDADLEDFMGKLARFDAENGTKLKAIVANYLQIEI